MIEKNVKFEPIYHNCGRKGHIKPNSRINYHFSNDHMTLNTDFNLFEV